MDWPLNRIVKILSSSLWLRPGCMLSVINPYFSHFAVLLTCALLGTNALVALVAFSSIMSSEVVM